MSDYSLEVSREELDVLVEALRIQRERWHDVLVKKAANDASVSEIAPATIQKAIETHDGLLARLPTSGSSF